MATKTQAKKPPPNRIASPMHYMPLATQIFSKEISLPSAFSVAYACFSPTTLAQQYQDVDSARRSLVDANSSQPPFFGLLPYVDVSKGSATLWVFHINNADISEDSLASRTHFERLNFQGLLRSQEGRFSYQDIYPCSSTCSDRRDPCSVCTAQYPNTRVKADFSSQCMSPSTNEGTPNMSTPLFSSCSTPTPTSLRSASSFLPRRPLRKAHDFFLDAIRERFIDDLCNDNTCLRRMCNGVLLGFPEHQSVWGDGWDHHDKLRPLIFCQIEATLFPSAVLLQPNLRPTQLLPASALVPGTPINLLPFFTPAYFLNHYAGSKSALIRQFQTNLKGLGCGCWPSESRRTSDDSATRFIVAWLSVENKQGEEKGMMIVWPADLCVTLVSLPKQGSDSQTDNRYAYDRKQLNHIPDLPPALQSSPVPAPAVVPAQRGVSPNDCKALIAGPSTDWTLSPQNETSPLTPFQVHPQMQIRINRPFLTRARSSFFTNMLYSHKAFTSVSVRRQNVRRVSAAVGRFVDSVAKERERERERMRKEREAAAAAGQAQKEHPTTQSIASSSSVTAFPINIPTTPARTARAVIETLIPPLPTPSITVNLQPLTFPTNTQQLLTGVSQLQTVPTYPSPPDELMKSVPSAVSLDNQAAPIVTEIPDTDIDQQDVRSSEDVEFGNAFGIEISDFNMDFGHDTNTTIANAGQHASAVDALQAMDIDLSIFTDDDFNFFDDPSTSTISLSVNQTTEQASAAMDGMANSLSGLGISADFADASTISNLFSGTSLTADVQPWLTEAFNTSTSAFDTSFSAPELVPPSPDKSTTSTSGPATPHVLFVLDIDAAQSSSSDDEPFNAIAFPDGIQKVDQKYRQGKFVMQCEGKTVDVDTGDSTSPYGNATDPKHAIIRKLKSKWKQIPGSPIESSLFSAFYEEHSEWLGITDEDSEASSTSGHDSDDGSWVDEDEGFTTSRPSTPLPSSLPPGPSLLATRFTHPALLSLATSLRSSGAPFPISDLASPVPNPVPTPVSPAAILGATSEKSKSLEAAARMLCREAIENVVWLDAWRSNSAVTVVASEELDNLSHANFKDYVKKKGVDLGVVGIDRVCEIASVHGQAKDEQLSSSAVAAYKPPDLSVGKGDTVMNVLPSAVPFWSKLGLGPRSGPKDVVAFVIFQGSEAEQEHIGDWLKRMSSCYDSKGFGNHILGNARLGGKDGIIPVNFESFRKNLISLIESLETRSVPILFYVVIPTYILSLGSLALRQILSGIRRVKLAYEEKRLHFHFLPDNIFAQSDDYASSLAIDALALSVYDRIARPMQRMMLRPYKEGLGITTHFFSAPAFTLARPSTPNISITYKYPMTDVGSLDRYMFLHVGYKLSPCRKWIMTACIDQRGEGSDMEIWLMQDDQDWRQVVDHLWKFSEDFLKRANLEWRVVFTKLGSMGEDELDAWNNYLALDSFNDTPLHVSIVSVNDDAGWLFLSPSRLSSLSSSATTAAPSRNSHGTDSVNLRLISSASTLLSLPGLLRIPLLSPCDIDLLGGRDFIPDESEDSSMDAAMKNREHDRLRPLQTGVLFDISGCGTNDKCHPGSVVRTSYVHLLGTYASASSTFSKTDEEHHKDIIHNYHDLLVLTQTRWRHHTYKPTLPFHLASLRIMEEILTQNSGNGSVNDTP